ncbi:MAG: hypothetical protein K6U00_06315, partial [Armatimonadetes bacterium]|nr:hypothetical protein [Armatimonadota bacterium]
GAVENDLMAVGGQVSLPGSVAQSASVAGGSVNVTGKVSGNLRAAGGTIDLSGVSDSNVSLVGGTINLVSNARIARDLSLAAGQATISGTVGGNLFAKGGQVTVNGRVRGNAKIAADRVIIGSGAVIDGDLIYSSPRKAEIASGARITGITIYQPQPMPEKREAGGFKFGMWLLSFLMLFLVGVVLTALTPALITGVADRLARPLWMSLLIGFALLIGIPVVVIISMITIIGIPLALILLAVYLISVYISRLFVGIAIGRLLFAKLGKPSLSPYLSLLVGLLILWILIGIPYIGWFVHLVALITGLGGLAVQRFHMLRDLRREGRL